jgi:peptidoglycan/LPS O-acetylase OafA/YrhL
LTKRLIALSGISIVAVVLNHTAAYGQFAMFLWVHRYRPIPSPNWDLIGSVPYYVSLALRQFGDFSVPAFLFIAGFFVAYASQASGGKLAWSIVWKRVKNLLIPYILWSGVMFTVYYFLGTRYTPVEYLALFLSQGADPSYFYIPLLTYLYLLSPVLVAWVKRNSKAVLAIAAALQITTALIIYFALLGMRASAISFLLKITPDWSIPRWIFFFTLGIFSGLNIEPFRRFLNRHQRSLIVMTLIFYLLTILESDLLLRGTLRHWGAHIGSFSYMLYAVCFILSFMAVRTIPFERLLSRLGSKTYGIYLIHFLVIMLAAKFIYRFVPQLLAYQTLFQSILFALGLGLPLAFMEIVERTPARRVYRYVFG